MAGREAHGRFVQACVPASALPATVVVLHGGGSRESKRVKSTRLPGEERYLLISSWRA